MNLGGNIETVVPSHTYSRLRFDDAADQAVQHLALVLQSHRGSPYEGQFVSQAEPRAGTSHSPAFNFRDDPANTVFLGGEKNLTCASLAAARVSHRPRPDFPVGESIASLLFDGIEDSAPGLPSNDVLRASRSSHQCSPISPIPPHFPGMGCSPPHIALLSGLEGTGMTGRQITDVMNSIAMQFGPVKGRLLPRCKCVDSPISSSMDRSRDAGRAISNPTSDP